ncbi:hypothetical protein ACIQAC_18335 [Streptomyces sp. NPDC088387]|uniref:hypothetical protein n=1 Tax=Streptomyces sp. NPDC088387 TaxID=3365859 RepID=UPI0038250CCA
MTARAGRGASTKAATCAGHGRSVGYAERRGALGAGWNIDTPYQGHQARIDSQQDASS